MTAADTERTPGHPSRLRRILRRAGLVFGSITVTLLLGEVAVRLFTETAPGLEIRNPEFGSHHIPGWKGEVYNWETERKIPLRFDREGFRGADRPYRKDPGVTRIAILGDSMIAALEVEEELTLVRQLEKLLRKSHPQRRFEVFNFGIGGASPGQSLVLYRKLAARYEPDIVVNAFFVGNDLSDNCARLTDTPRIYFDLDESGALVQQPFSGARARASAWLNRNSRLYVWKKRVLSKLRRRFSKAAGIPKHTAQIFATNPTGDVAHAWAISDALVRAWAREAADRGAVFVQMVVPTARQVFDDGFAKLIQELEGKPGEYDANHPDQHLGDLCRAEGIPFLSLRPAFRKAAPSASYQVTKEHLHNKGIAHLNERGHRVGAQALHRYLTREPSPGGGAPLIDRKP